MSEATQVSVTANTAWPRVKARLRDTLGQPVVDNWFGSVQVEDNGTKDDLVVLSVATPFLVNQITNPLYLPAVEKSFSEELGRVIAVKVSARRRGMPVREKIEAEAASRSTAINNRPGDRYIVSVVSPVTSSVNGEGNKSSPKPPSSAESQEKNHLDYLVQELFQDAEQVEVRTLAQMMARVYRVPFSMILTPKRVPDYVLARQTAIYLASIFTELSLGKIGRQMGGRDYSSVASAIERVKKLRTVDRKFDADTQSYIDAIERWRSRKR